jgi:hypothetical protein
LTTRSDDGGRSFGPAKPVSGSDATGNRGWEATAPGRDGRVIAIWLDHRELVETGRQAAPMHHDGQAHTGHASESDGAARAQLSKLYFGSVDGMPVGRPLTGGVCYCCKTALAVGADGSVYAAWRHVYPGNIRDIAFTVSRDEGRTFSAPVRVSEDRWVLDGCPENGPALAVDGQNRVHVVWPTIVPGSTADSEPTLALFYATSLDGRQFTPKQRLETQGIPRHPQIAVESQEQAVVTWDEQVNGVRRVVVGHARSNGSQSARFVREVVNHAAPAVYPVVASVSEATLVAWVEGASAGSIIRVKRLPN